MSNAKSNSKKNGNNRYNSNSDKNKDVSNYSNDSNSTRKSSENKSTSKSGSKSQGRKNSSTDGTPKGATQLYKDVTNFFFNKPLGTVINIADGEYAGSFVPNSIPGLAAFGIMPTFGYSEDSNSAINVASRDIYSYVRHQNSGSKNYDPVDLMLYLLAADNIYSFIAYLKTVYGVSRLFFSMNRYYPRQILRAYRVDADDVICNPVRMRQLINTLIMKMRKINLPASLPVFDRHQKLFSHIYADADNLRCQSYIYSPIGFYKYDEMAVDTGGKLTFKPLVIHEETAQLPSVDNFHYWTISDLEAYGNELIDAMMLSEDVGIISGDIMKAYNDLLVMEPIAEDYTTDIVMDPVMLNRIHNTRALPGSIYNYDLTDATKWSCDITQNNAQDLICQPHLYHPLNLTTAPILGKHIMDIQYGEPTNGVVFDACTDTHCFEYDTETSMLTPTSFGMDLVFAPIVYTYSSGTITNDVAEQVINISVDEVRYQHLAARNISIATAFGSFPMQYLVTGTEGDWQMTPLYHNVTNPQVISDEELRNLRVVDTMYQFNII